MAVAECRSPGPEEKARGFYARVLDLARRFEFSVQIFVVAVIVACGVEIVIGWNAFFKEVTITRGRLEEKARSYLGVLSRAGLPPVLQYDWDRMDLYARQILEDEDVVFVRFVDSRGQVIYQKGKAAYREHFLRTHGCPLVEGIGPLLDRHAKVVMFRPDLVGRLRERETRRDFITRYNAAIERLKAWVGAGKVARPSIGATVYYQDRAKDGFADFAYGIAPVTDKLARVWGGIVLGFSLDRVNGEIRGAFVSNLLMTLFFVALVVVNNVLTRREKLAAKAMADEIASAKAFFSTLLPDGIAGPDGMAVDTAHLQSPNIGGGFFAVNPRGRGLDVVVANTSAAGLAASYRASMFEALILRRMRAEDVGEPATFLRACLGDFATAGVTGTLDLLLARVEEAPGGVALRYFAAGMAAPAVVNGDGALLAPERLLRPLGRSLDTERPLEGEEGALTLEPGSRIVIFEDGLNDRTAQRRFGAAELAEALRGLDARAAGAKALADAAAAVYKDGPPDDVVALVISLRPPTNEG